MIYSVDKEEKHDITSILHLPSNVNNYSSTALFSSFPLSSITHFSNFVISTIISVLYLYTTIFWFLLFLLSSFNLLLSFLSPFQAVLLCPYGDPKCVYPFGADPVWKISANELLFFNSMKMKMFVHVHLIHSFRFVVFLFSFLSALTISSNLTLFFISFSHFCSLHQVGHPWHFTDDFWSLSEGHQRPLLPLLP